MDLFSRVFNVLGELTHLARTLFTDGIHCIALCTQPRAALAAENSIPPNAEDPMPEVPSIKIFKRVVNLIMRLHNSVIMIFEIAPEEFRPSFCTREVKGKTYTIVDEWCSGFLQGIALAGDAWQPLLDKKPGAWFRLVPRELQESLRWDAMRLAPVGAGRNTNTAVVPLAHCIDSTSGNG